MGQAEKHRPSEHIGTGRACECLEGLLIASSTARSSPAAAITTSATITARPATTPVFSGSGFIDGEGSPASFLTIQTVNCGLSLLIAAHFDESEAF